MALAETAELAVKLSLEDKLSPAVNKINKGLGGLGSTAKTVGKGIAVGLGAAAVGGIAILGSALKSGIEALRADQVVAAQTAAVLKSTGQAAGLTAQDIADLADKYSTLDGVQDDVVQSAENVLLTFTNIKKDAFEPATQAALDFAAATGRDASDSARLLGRALNDPVKGMGLLGRAGISLDKSTQDRIKSLAKEGKLDQAQAILLKELATRYGGVAKAQADADPSRRLQVSVEKLQKALAKGLLPVIEKIQTRLTDFLSKPETIATIQRLGESIAALFSDENLNTVASGMEVAADAISKALSLFNQLPPEVKALAVGAFAINKVTGGAVTGIAGLLGQLVSKGIGKIFAANVTVIGTNVTGPGGGLPGIPAGGAAGAGGGIAADLAPLSGAALAATAAVAGLAAGIGDAVNHGLNTVFSAMATQLGGIGAGKVVDLAGQFLRDTFFPGIDDIFSLVTSGHLADKPGVTGTGAKGVGQLGNPNSALGATRDMDKNLASAASVLANLDHNGIKLSNLDALAQSFRSGIAGLATATGAAIVPAVDQVVSAIQAGRGNAKNTLTALQLLKAQLKNTHDPTLQAVLRDAIDKVQHKLTGREWVQKQLDKADQIYKSNLSDGEKIKRLQTIEKEVGNKSKTAGERVRQKVDQLKTSQAVKLADANRHLKAIQAKKNKFTVNAYSSPVYVSVRETKQGIKLSSRVARTTSLTVR